MKHPNERRFEDFFGEDKYVLLKNHLYNYLLRKRAIGKRIPADPKAYILEVGSGLSPMVTTHDRIVYSELSFRALKTLKDDLGRGSYVVADGTQLPFKDGSFSHTVCSEVLEHVEDDRRALRELGRVMSTDGLLCLTVPHRRFYYAADDRFVRHFRRYELDEIEEKLQQAGLESVEVAKVLGPLEKVTMFTTVMTFSLTQRFGSIENRRPNGLIWNRLTPLFKWLNRAFAVVAWLDAKIMPRALATVVLVEAKKTRRE